MAVVPRNWQRYYRITFGIPAYELETYYVQGSVIPANVAAREGATQSVPSNALKISNIPSDGNSLRGFNFALSTKRTISKSATRDETSVLTILNLSPKMYKLFNTEGCVVKIEAGYKDQGVSVVYNGFVQKVEVKSGKGSDDISYLITMKDAGLDVKNTKVSVDFPETSDIVESLEALIKMFPSVSSQSLALQALKGVVVAGGFSFEGKLIEVIQKICKTYKIDYSILNGKFFARMEQLFQGSEDYNKLVPNTYVFTPDTIKSLDPIIDNSNKESGQKNTKRKVLLSTFLTPISFDNFFTVPSDISKELAGTYKINTIEIKLNSRTSLWDTVIIGEPM